MQEPWGWGAADPQNSDAVTRRWQGQWESHGCGESSGWGASSWDQLGTDGNSHYEEYENVMRWDDSGALDAFETAKKLNEERSKGWTYSVSLPSPDLYIQAIDWNSHEDLKLPDPGGTLSPPRKGQRKRGRRAGGGFRREFDRQETSHVDEWKQSTNPSQAAYQAEGRGQPEQERVHDRGASMVQGSLDSGPRGWSPSEMQSAVQDPSRSNWSTRWGSPYQKQSSNWNDYGRSRWDRQQNLQSHSSQQRWTNVQSEQTRGRGHGGVPHWSSAYGLSNEPHYQANPGNDWMRRQEANVPSFTQQPPNFHFSTGSRHQHAPSYAPDKTRRWRPPPQQQQHNHRWQ